jgi:DNA-binding NtrC family response regulator
MEYPVHQSDVPNPELPGLVPTEHLAYEVICAAQAGTSVLISGERDAVTVIARRVHDLKPVRAAFVVVDCGQDEAFLSHRVAEALSARPSGGRTLFLRDVDRLTPRLQSLVASHLGRDAARAGPGAAVQVIASTSVALLKRVSDGTFDEGLFYRLNTIHIVVAR